MLTEYSAGVSIEPYSPKPTTNIFRFTINLSIQQYSSVLSYKPGNEAINILYALNQPLKLQISEKSRQQTPSNTLNGSVHLLETRQLHRPTPYISHDKRYS